MVEVKAMPKDELREMPVMPRSETPGLTSMEQLVDTTSNEIFSFQSSTSEMEKPTIILRPFHEKEEKDSRNA